MEQEQKALPWNEVLIKFASNHGLENEVGNIFNMPIDIDWKPGKKRGVRKGYIVSLFEKHNLLDAFKDKHWTYGKTPEGEKKQKQYISLKNRYEDILSRSDVEDEIGNDQEGDDTEQRFRIESDLRDFLSNNLSIIEPGLKLYQRGEQRGVEYPIDDGRIDILAVDKNGKYVVIELKVSRGRNRAVGQLCYYMGWVDDHLGNGTCRGMIISGEISEDLIIALKRVPGASVFRYRLSVTIEPSTNQ